LGGEVLALSGELGSGKTCFVRGLAAGLGAARLAVTSPTFVFIHEYVGRLRLAHADLFRLEGVPAYYELGLTDYLNERTIVAIEWPEKAECELPMDRLVIKLSHKGKNVRELRFQSYGAVSLAFLARLRKLKNFPIVAASRNVRSEVRLKRSQKESAHTPASIRRSAHK